MPANPFKAQTEFYSSVTAQQKRSFLLCHAGMIWAENWQEPNFKAGLLLPPLLFILVGSR